MVPDSQKRRGGERWGAKRVMEGNPRQRYCIFDGGCQVEVGAGERSVLGDQSSVPQLDLPPHQFEMVLLGADGGHRIADEGNVARIFCAKGGPYNERIDIDAIENEARSQTV